MTVRELIDILNTCDENANVLIEASSNRAGFIQDSG